MLAQLDPTDRAIAVMRLVDAPDSGIAEALRTEPGELERRLEAILVRLSSRPAGVHLSA